MKSVFDSVFTVYEWAESQIVKETFSSQSDGNGDESCNSWVCSVFQSFSSVYFLVLSLKALEVPGVKVLRFESSLYFGNVERFRSALIVVTGRDPSIQKEKRQEVEPADKHADDEDKLLENENGHEGCNSNERISNGVNSNVKINKLTRRIEERMEKCGKSARMETRSSFIMSPIPDFYRG